jgi:hypothetical protein
VTVDAPVTHAYRAVKNAGELKVGQIFRDPHEAQLATDISSLDAGEGTQVWAVDLSGIAEASADQGTVRLPAGTHFKVVGFDYQRGIWNVDACR